MKELIFYLLGSFSGVFLMCALTLSKKENEYNHKKNKK